eukprot:gene33305-40290_t
MENKRSDIEDTTPPAKSPSGGAKEANPGRRVRRDRRADDNPPAEEKASTPKAEEAPQGDGQKQRRRRPQEGGGDAGGGWMSLESDNSRNKKLSMMSMEDDEADRDAPVIANNKDKHFQEGDGEVLIIPDLDEEAGIDVDQRVAHAPRNVHRKIPTLAELEEEMAGSIPAQEGGINLQVLTSTLVPAQLLYEEDSVWTFESLLREVQEELSELPKPKEKSASQQAAAASAEAGKTSTSKTSGAGAKQNKKSS